MTMDHTLWLLQANDSAYPSGAYAHSFGLEELVDSGIVTTAADLGRFLETQILPALLAFDLPFFARAHEAARHGDLTTLCAMDEELDAWRLPAETREASRRIGSQRLELLGALGVSPLALSFRNESPRGHHLIVTAIELAALPVATAGRAFAYQTISGFTAASMKLIRIGQNSCQKLLRHTLDLIDREIDAALVREADGWFNPLLEIASLRHARSHARLFIS